MCRIRLILLLISISHSFTLDNIIWFTIYLEICMPCGVTEWSSNCNLLNWDHCNLSIVKPTYEWQIITLFHPIASHLFILSGIQNLAYLCKSGDSRYIWWSDNDIQVVQPGLSSQDGTPRQFMTSIWYWLLKCSLSDNASIVNRKQSQKRTLV